MKTSSWHCALLAIFFAVAVSCCFLQGVDGAQAAAVEGTVYWDEATDKYKLILGSVDLQKGVAVGRFSDDISTDGALQILTGGGGVMLLLLISLIVVENDPLCDATNRMGQAFHCEQPCFS